MCIRDSIEVVAAYQAADGNLQTSVTNLSNTASTDRALIRTEIAAAKVVDDAALAAELVARAAGDTAAATDRGAVRSEFAAADAAIIATAAANKAAEELRMDAAGDFAVASDVGAGLYSMEWGGPGDSKPKVTFAIDSGVVTMSVELN